MFDKELIEKVCNLTCTEEDIDRPQTTIKYDTEYPFKKYYRAETIVQALYKCLHKEWDENMLAHWCCIYDWILCGGFDDDLKEDLNPLEEFLRETISWNLDGLSFLSNGDLKEEGANFLKTIEHHQNLGHVWENRAELKAYHSSVGEIAKMNEDQFMVLIDETKKEYMIIYSEFFDDDDIYDKLQSSSEEDFKKLIQRLRSENYTLLSYDEEAYYEAENE